jgi:formamidopyrimidine-DNA glycosylase
MPELPEVEYGRKQAENALVGKRVAKVVCDNDEIVFDGVQPKEVAIHLKGQRIEAAHRRGKYMWLEIPKGPYPMFHFGMTGRFHVWGQDAIKLETGPKVDPELWPPRFCKIEIVMDDDTRLAMTNARRLGRIRLLSDPLKEGPIAKLGFDPLLSMPPLKEFQSLVGVRKTTLKGLLLNQAFAAGVGNWIADEVLYQAGLAPTRRANALTSTEVKALHKSLGSIVRKAVSVDADKSRFPKSWLFHHRWGQVEGATTAKGESIEYIKVAGRTTAWVPAVQS